MKKPLMIGAAIMIALPFVATADTLLLTGGATSFDGDDAILTFTNSGTLTVTGSGTVDVLLVGGGSGGYGGGSGFVIIRYRYESNAGFVISIQ